MSDENKPPPLAALALKVVSGSVLLAGLAALGAWSLANQPALAADTLSPAQLSSLQPDGTWLPPTPSTQPKPPRRQSASALAHPHKKKEAPARSEGLTADGKVILNRAGADDLVKLPGVGRKRAEAILALRKRLKRFRRVTDLLRVRGIGVRSLKRMRPSLVLDPPKEEEKLPEEK